MRGRSEWRLQCVPCRAHAGAILRMNLLEEFDLPFDDIRRHIFQSSGNVGEQSSLLPLIEQSARGWLKSSLPSR